MYAAALVRNNVISAAHFVVHLFVRDHNLEFNENARRQNGGGALTEKLRLPHKSRAATATKGGLLYPGMHCKPGCMFLGLSVLAERSIEPLYAPFRWFLRRPKNKSSRPNVSLLLRGSTPTFNLQTLSCMKNRYFLTDIFSMPFSCSFSPAPLFIENLKS